MKKEEVEKISSGKILEKLDKLVSNKEKIAYLKEILKAPLPEFMSKRGYIELHLHLAHLYEDEAKKLSQEESYEEAEEFQANALALYKNFTDYEIQQEKTEKNLKRYRIEKNLDAVLNFSRASSILAFFLGLVFLSPNITGAAIGNFNLSSSNLVGEILLVFGIIGLFATIKRRKTGK